METIIELDIKLFLFLNSLHNSVLDEIMQILSNRYVWIPFYLLLIFIFFYKRNIKSGIITTIFIILVLVVTDKISVLCFKDFFCRLRPSRNPDLEGLVHLVDNYKGGMYGFISSHAANTFAIAIFTIQYFKNRIFTISILVWALVLSYSRIYLGVHYPGDVFGGMLFGILSGFLFFKLYIFVLKRLKIDDSN